MSRAGKSSPYSLYNQKLATYTSEDQFDHTSSEGFIKIFGLPVRTYHQVNKNGTKEAASKEETPVSQPVQ
jgi:argininosuccinate synthase